MQGNDIVVTSVRLSVCPSIRPYPPLILSSYRPIFKILFLFERYDMRDLTFKFLSVRLSVLPFPYSPFNFRSVPPFNFRSNRQISKILYLFERYDIISLYFLSVCPYPLSPSVLTIRFSTKNLQESRLFQFFQNFLFFKIKNISHCEKTGLSVKNEAEFLIFLLKT